MIAIIECRLIDRRPFSCLHLQCWLPLISGYIFYKFTFNLTERQPLSYQNPLYSQSIYPGAYYTMCTPVIQNVNDLLRETVRHCIRQSILSKARALLFFISAKALSKKTNNDNNNNNNNNDNDNDH